MWVVSMNVSRTVAFLVAEFASVVKNRYLLEFTVC